MVQFILFIEDAFGNVNSSNVFIFLILNTNNNVYNFKIFNENTQLIFSISGNSDYCSKKSMEFVNTLGKVQKVSKIQQITSEQILFKDIGNKIDELVEDVSIEIDLESDNILDIDIIKKLFKRFND